MGSGVRVGVGGAAAAVAVFTWFSGTGEADTKSVSRCIALNATGKGAAGVTSR